MEKGKMTLGERLVQLREEVDRPRVWVERRSKELYPNDKSKHISHTFLRTTERDEIEKVSIPQLQALAEIYQTDFEELAELAGYPVSDKKTDELWTIIRSLSDDKMALLKQYIDVLIRI
jgi:hypothetical protein